MNFRITDRLLISWRRRNWRGFHFFFRLHQKLTGRSTLRVRTRFGTSFDLPPGDYIPDHVLREGYYESEVLEAIRPYLGSGAVLWDIGANFGLHSITAKALSPDTTVVAFEPNPAMASCLRQHAALNHVDVRVEELALAAATAQQTLHVVKGGNPGMSTLHPWAQAHYDAIVTVRCLRGDELVASGQQPAPTVIKLDVEGGEADVLAGLGRLLQAPSLRAIVFEGDAKLESAAADHPVAGPLRQAGFRLSPLARHEDTAHTLENYLAVRP